MKITNNLGKEVHIYLEARTVAIWFEKKYKLLKGISKQ